MPDSPASRLLRAVSPLFPDKLAGGELLSELLWVSGDSSRCLTLRQTALLIFPFFVRHNPGALFELRIEPYAHTHTN